MTRQRTRRLTFLPPAHEEAPVWTVRARLLAVAMVLVLAVTGMTVGGFAPAARAAGGGPGVGAGLVNSAQTTILTQQPLQYSINAADGPATNVSVTATLTNAVWGQPTATDSSTYCVSYGGTFSFGSNGSAWTCSGFSFTTGMPSVAFNPTAFVPNSTAAGAVVKLKVTITDSNGSSDTSAPDVTVATPTATVSMGLSAAVSSSGGLSVGGSLTATANYGIVPVPSTVGVSFQLTVPNGTQTCTNPSDSYGGPSCTAATTVPYTLSATNAGVTSYPNESNYTSVSPPRAWRDGSQASSGAVTYLNSGTTNAVYPLSSTKSYADSLFRANGTINADWVASLRYPGSSPAAGSYVCQWTAASTTPGVTLTTTSGTCPSSGGGGGGGGFTPTPASMSVSMSNQTGTPYANPFRVFPGSTFSQGVRFTFTNTGSTSVPAGGAVCLKFDNSRTVLSNDPGNASLQYGSGNWGSNAADVAHSAYAQGAANCLGTQSISTWYSASQVDFTNSNAAGTLINANQINVIRQTQGAIAGGGTAGFSYFGGWFTQRGIDSRGVTLKAGDRSIMLPQFVTPSGAVTDYGQCAGADTVAQTCPTDSSGAIPQVPTWGVQGYGPMSTAYTFNGSTNNIMQNAYTPAYVGSAVSGQFVSFVITTDGQANRSTASVTGDITSQPRTTSPALVVPNVTTTTSLPVGLIVDCTSVSPAPVTCTSTGSGASTQYTISWLSSVTQGASNRYVVPAYVSFAANAGTQTVQTNISAPGQQYSPDDNSLLQFSVVKQNQPAVTMTAPVPAVLPGEQARWNVALNMPTGTSADTGNTFLLLPYDGDPFGSIVKGSYALSGVDVTNAAGSTVYVSSVPQASIDALDGKSDGYLNPQNGTAQSNAATINADFSCTIAQVGSAGCPASMAAVTALRITGGPGYLPPNTVKTIAIGVDTTNLKIGDSLQGTASAQLGSYVTFYTDPSQIVMAKPSFTVNTSVSPTTEVNPGGTATYSVTVTNTGNVSLPFRALTPTVTTDISGLIDDAATPTITNAAGGLAWISGGTLSWTPPAIAAGASATLTFTAVAANPPSGDKILKTKVTAQTNTYAATPSGLDCPSGSTASFCSTSVPVAKAPVITSAAPTTSAVKGQPYSFTVTATGYTTPTFSVASGSLPAGLTLNSTTGVISGTPTTNGTSTFTIAASNSSPNSPAMSGAYTITVGEVPVITSSAPTTPATVGTSYSFTVTASGVPAPTFSVSAGSLPAGLSLNTSTGVISGTPTTAGTYTYTVTASNAVGSASASYTTLVASTPVITSGAPTSPGIVGAPYSFTVTASGSPAPTFTVSSGSLPAGLSLNSSTGVISGTPTTTGSYTYTITASNGAATSASASYTTTIVSKPAITSSTPPSGITNSAYSFTVTASGTPAPTFSISSGSLPSGLSLNSSTGKITGTPTTAGSYTYTVTATNAGGSASASYTTVISSLPALTSGTPTTPATVGTAYSFTFTASGSPAPSFSVLSGTLPSGLSLNSTSGVLSGTPTTAGSYSFTIKADNGVGAAAQGSYTIDVYTNPTITSAAPTTPATRGVPYSFTMTASGTPAPSFTVSSGTLPAGLTLSSTGVISGTPTTAGSSTFTVTASNGSATNASATYTLAVYVAPAITSAAPSNGTVNSAYSYTVTATGTPAPTFSVSSGSLPTGLTLNASTGVISGTPSAAGSYTYTIKAANGGSPDATATYTTVIASVPVITSGAPTSPATVGSAYSFTVTASGSPAPTFAVSSGSLPAGLSLNGTTGVISGTPTAPGSASFTITASNGANASASANYTLVTATVPTITSGAPPTGTTTVAYSYTVTATGSPAPTFAVSSGSLPTGLSLNTTTGVISGTPTATGAFTYTIRASNGASPSATANYTTNIVSNPVITSAAPTSPATVGTAYTFQITASGTPAPTFAMTSGSLPGGLSMDSTGKITGTPTTPGAYTFTVKASNGSATDASANYTLNVVSDPAITSLAPSTPTTVGDPYSFTVTATGTPAPSFSISSGSLPPGLSLNSSTGVISGASTTAGSYAFTLKADNGSANPATANYTIRVVSDPTITSGNPTSPAVVGTAYSFTVTASASPAASFSLAAGTLPTGLSLNASTGVISGTPTAQGTYSFTIRADNGSSHPATAAYSVTVNAPPVITSGTPSSPATVGTAYSFTVTASGTPSPTFSISAGSLPTGLSISSAGVISGTPTTAGSYTYTVKAANSLGNVTASYTTVVASVPAITSGTPPTATVGSAYSFTVTASGSPAPTFTVTSGSLPAGLSLNATTGVISGTPTTTGSSTYTITAANGASTSATATYTTVTASVPAITSAAPADGVVGTAYSFTVTASGSPAPTFAVSTGSLPSGLSLNATTGVISGTPTTAGTYTYSIEASNPANASDTKSYTTTITEAPTLTSGTPTSPATVGTAYSFTFTASGSPSPTFSVTSGSLPAGLALNATTGVLSGTPTTAGSSSFTVTASNGVGTAASGSYTIAVYTDPVITSAAPTATAVRGTGYSFTVTASGSPAPTFAVASGSLPAGLTLNSSTGVISGTPTTNGTSTFTIKADNGSANPATSSSYSIQVGDLPVITSGTPTTPGTVNVAYSFTVTASGTPSPTFTVSSGSLPTGLSLSSAGVISGTPTAAGTYTYTVQAANAIGSTSASYTTVIASVPAITSGSPTSPAVVGTAYSFTVTASGSPAPTFAVSSGSLPAGLSLNASTGVISGTPTTAASYTFTITASNGASTSASATYTVLAASTPAITSSAPPSGVTGTAYSHTVTASGSPAPTFSVSTGSLPTGLSLNTSTGAISGTPTTTGSFTYTVTATNAGGSASANYTTVISSVPALTSGSPTSPATVGTAYSFTFTASGSPAPTFSVASGTLPAGLSLNTSTGVLSGTPTTTGSSTFAIKADNGIGSGAQSTYTIDVYSDPTITSGSPTSPATKGTAYSFTVTATGTPAATFSVSSGSLPAGLSMSSTGVISGTPTATGSSTFTVKADNGSANPATRSYTIAVYSDPTITSAAPTSPAAKGAAYSFTVTATGSPAPSFSVASGSLPAGLSLNASTGVISGTPTTNGTSTFTIQAANGSANPAVSSSYSILVGDAPAITSSAPTSPGTVSTAYSFTVTASGSPAPTFAVSSGSLPTGLSLNTTTGVISGTPTTAGSSSYTITATNALGTASASYTTVIASVPVITSGNPTSPVLKGSSYSFPVTASGSPAPTFAVSSGSLPAGLSLNTTTGVISGTPTANGSSNFTVTAANGAASSASAAYTVLVGEAPAVTSSAPTSPATVGTAYSFTVTASGSPAPNFSVSTGSLPAGLLLNSSTGLISGTPTAAGTYSYSIEASNALGTDTRSYSTTVASNPVITSGAPTSPATRGSAYSFTVTATGSPSPTFSVASGSLPAGLSLNAATGVISGTPTTNGTSTFTVKADNGSANPATSGSYSILVGDAPVITSGTPTTPGTVNVAYSFTMTATGSPTPSFAVTSGALPTGLTLTSAGVLAGTPTAAGSYTYTVAASNALGAPTATYTTVIASVPAITSGTPTSPAVVGTAYSFTVTASGSPAPTFTVSSGSLPTGLSLNASTGVISGTPTTAGSYSFTVTASNGAATSASASYTILAASTPVITSSAPPSGVTGTAYSHTVTASGSPAPTFSVSSGSLPTGLSLNSSTGVISGTPTTVGSYPYSITATNAGGSATANYTTVISSVPGLTSGTPTSPATVGTAYSFTFTASGSPAPSFSVASGTLPTGLTLSSSSGVLSGTPSATGAFTFTIEASNGIGSPAQSTYTIDVYSDPTITSAAPTSPATVGTAYSFTVTASGTPAAAFSVSSGSLPAGLSMSSTGVISGTPTATGSSTFTVKADNGSANPATRSYTVAVYSDPTITSAAPTSPAAKGAAYSFTVTATGTPAPTFSVASGSLPAGLTLNASTGVISGTPTTNGTSTFTIEAANGSANPAVSSSYSILVGDTPAITSTAPSSPATENVPYSFTVTASGSPAPTFSVTSGSLPTGLSLNTTSGVISGTPTTAGSYSYTVTATNALGTDAKSYTTVVASVPAITSGNPTSPAVVGTAYSFTVTATGSPAPTFAVTSGSLPAGLSMNASTGVIAGTPTTAGSYAFDVTASNGAATSATGSYTVLVASTPAITSSTPPSGVTGTAYSFTVTASGSPAPTFAVSSGSLPTGLSLNTATGVISGTPSTVGSYTYTVTATNAGGSDAKSYTTVVSSTPALTSGTPTSPATVGTAYSFTFTASGTPAPSFAVASGTLPSGLTLNSASGVLSGTPTVTGSYTFTIAADNGVGSAAQGTYTIDVYSDPVITSGNPTSPATVGTAYSFTMTASGAPAPSFFLVGGSLPAGLSLSSTGVISGTPTAAGSSTFYVAAVNGSANAASAAYTIDTYTDPTITSAAPTSPATRGAAYSFTVTASGSPAPTFSVASGSLPAGLSLNSSTGVISGAPTTNGTSTFTIQADNGSANPAVSGSYSILVGDAPVITSTAPTTPATENVVYSFTVTASGSPAPTFAVSSGTLPTGLTLNASTGVISGTPSAAGTYTYTVEATNAIGSASASYTTVVASVPAITSGGPTSPAVVGTAYSFTVTASGSPAPTFAVSSGSLPAGLSLNASTGVISGTPTTAGSFSFTVTASNGAASSASASYTILAASTPVITSSAPPSGVTGTAYSFTVTASGSPAPTFSVSSGSLPTGLSLNTSTGVISGTPTTTGSFAYTIEATNAGGSDTANYTTVISSVPALTSGTPTSPATVGTAYSFTFTASGSPSPTFSVASGTVPSGLTLDPTTGELSGTPTATGAFTFTVKADNGIGSGAQSTYTIDVYSDPSITSGTPTSPATVGTAYSFTMTASGTPAATFTVSSGALPAGLSLAPNGVISGTPTAAGSSTFTVTADNGSANPATASYTIDTYTDPTITSAAPTSPAAKGAAYSFTVTATGSPAPSFSVASGSLPAGLSLNAATGVIRGTPTTDGTSTFTIRADNGSANPAVSGSYSILVGEAPAITSGAPTTPATENVPYTFTVTASGSPAPTFSITAGALPAGVTLNAATGEISGTPTTAGSYGFGVTATNALGTASASYTMVVASVPVFTSGAPTSPAVLGAPYSFTFSASGSPAPTFTVTSGALPTGLSLDPNTGMLSGTPTATGSYTYTVTAANGAATSATVTYTTAVASTPAMTSGSPSAGTVGVPYSFTFTASGTPAPTFRVASGALPAGLGLDPVTGVLSGTPTAAGTSSFTVEVDNGSGAPTTASYTLTIAAAPSTSGNGGAGSGGSGSGSGGSGGANRANGTNGASASGGSGPNGTGPSSTGSRMTLVASQKTVAAGAVVSFTILGANGAPVAIPAGAKLSSDVASDKVEGTSIRFTKAGKRTVTITVNGVTSTAVVTVDANFAKPATDGLRVALSVSTTDAGSWISVTVTGLDEYGNPYDADELAQRVTLTTDRSGDVIDGTRVQLTEPGMTRVTATLAGVSASATVDVAGGGIPWWWWVFPPALLLGAAVIGIRYLRGPSRTGRLTGSGV